MDPITQFKENQRVMWAGFKALEAMTGTVAPYLVRFARIRPGQEVLDVGCGTGVVALTAARAGARVTGSDLTPDLVAAAKENASITKLEVTFQVADVESLPFPDASFDVVVSQFGHMFAPRPEVAVKEMLRVLRPGGTVAFSTWPPEMLVGRTFTLMGKYGPPPPDGVTPPAQWGDPNVVRQRLGDAVKDLRHGRETMWVQALSPQHFCAHFEKTLGPAQKLLAMLDQSDPAKAAALRREYEALVSEFFADNHVRQDFLMSAAVKA